MLYSGSNSGGGQDSFKTAVIDTIVAEVQSTASDDRCVLLLGYEEQMKEMFQARRIFCSAAQLIDWHSIERESRTISAV